MRHGVTGMIGAKKNVANRWQSCAGEHRMVAGVTAGDGSIIDYLPQGCKGSRHRGGASLWNFNLVWQKGMGCEKNGEPWKIRRA